MKNPIDNSHLLSEAANNLDGLPEVFQIRAPSRLHFGLMELKDNEPHRFGGVGVMIQSLPTIIAFDGASRVDGHTMQLLNSRFTNEQTEKLNGVVRAMSNYLQAEVNIPPTRILQAPPAHQGLGSGTQFVASVASILLAIYNHLARSRHRHPLRSIGGQAPTIQADQEFPALRLWEFLEPSSPLAALQQCTQRGKRSFVGLRGFLQGGLIYDRGQGAGHASAERLREQRAEVKLSDSSGPISDRGITAFDASVDDSRTDRFEVPADWTIVLAMSDDATNISGELENQWMRECSAQPNPQRERMRDLIEHHMIPSLSQRDFHRFTDAVEEYGQLAGRLFEPMQKSIFRNDRVAAIVRHAKMLGGHGVGQSSWGPVVFSWFPSLDQANEFMRRWQTERAWLEVRLIATHICSRGACVQPVSAWEDLPSSVRLAGSNLS